MKKMLVLLLVTCVSGTAFAQRGMGGGMYGYHHDMGRGYTDMDNRGHRRSKGMGHMGNHRSDRGMGHHNHMAMMENMPEAQQQQLFSIREKFLTDMQIVKQKYETEELSLKLELKKIETSIDKRDRRAEKEFSTEHAKVMLQAQEIKMQLHDLHRKARNEIDALKMKMEQDCHKIYQDWVNSL